MVALFDDGENDHFCTLASSLYPFMAKINWAARTTFTCLCVKPFFFFLCTFHAYFMASLHPFSLFFQKIRSFIPSINSRDIEEVHDLWVCQRLISDLSCGVFQCSPLIEGTSFLPFLSAEALLGWSIYCTLLESAFFLWVSLERRKTCWHYRSMSFLFPSFLSTTACCYRFPFCSVCSHK